MTSTAPYREQYDRVKRWYERFSTTNQGRLHDTPSDNYLDEIYAFFQNCYHRSASERRDKLADAASLVMRHFLEPTSNSRVPFNAPFPNGKLEVYRAPPNAPT